MVGPLDEIWMTTQFSGWKAICHYFSQSSSAARSFYRSSVSFPLKMGLYSWQSSAKRRASELVTSGRSLMKVKKSSGPRTVPCGTPDNTSAVDEAWPSRRTCCSLFLRKYYSIVGFVHALRSTVVCIEASGELQCQTLLDPHRLGYVRCCQWWLITGSHRNVWIWSRVVYHSGCCVCRNDPSPDYGRYALKAYKLLKSERRGDSWMLDVGHLSWKPVQLKLIATHLV